MNIPKDVLDELGSAFKSGRTLSKAERFLMGLWLEQDVDVKPIPQPNPEPEIEPEQPRVIYRRASELNNRKKENWWQKKEKSMLDSASIVLSKKKKEIWVWTLGKKVGLRGNWQIYTKFLDSLRKDKRFILGKKGRKNVISLSLWSSQVQPKLAKHEKPMRKKSEYDQFRSSRIAALMKTGMSYGDAWRVTMAEYAQKKHGSIEVAYEFPALHSIDEESVAYLKDMLLYAARNGKKLEYPPSAYVLGISSEAGWVELMTECLMNGSRIAKALKVNKELVADGMRLFWR